MACLRILAIAVVFMLILSLSGSASVIGVSPSIQRFQKMIKGGYAEAGIVVTTSFTEPINAYFTPDGEISEWISLDPNVTEFVFSKDSPYTARLIIMPPEDTPNGNYSGMLKITTGELAAVQRGAGSTVLAQVGLLIYVEVIGDEIIECRAGAISALSTEVGNPFTVMATVHNDGNVRLRPEIRVDVWDQYRSRIVMSKTFFGEQILPTTSRQVIGRLENELETGQYFAEVILRECGVSQFTTFDVLEKGQIADSGVLIGIRTNPVTYTKEPMLILPIFRNTGNRKVIAQFKGEIRDMQTDRVVHVLESDKIEITPTDTMEWRMFYTPEKEGNYLISGRVIYNNKITFDEQSIVFRVMPKERGSGWLFYIFAYLSLGLIILILIGKIRKKKRKF